MLGTYPLLQADSVPLSPVLLLVLCAVAGVGTVLLLPSRREASLSRIGAVILVLVLSWRRRFTRG